MCDSAQAYVDKAMALLAEPAELRAAQQHLRTRRLQLPLFDSRRYSRDFEALLLRMWQRHEAGVAPDHLPALASLTADPELVVPAEPGLAGADASAAVTGAATAGGLASTLARLTAAAAPTTTVAAQPPVPKPAPAPAAVEPALQPGAQTESSTAADERAKAFDPLDYALKVAAIKRAVPRKRRRVVFLIDATQLFSALEPVVEELQRRPDRFELIFIALPHSYTGDLKQTFGFLHKRGLNPIAMAGVGSDLVRLISLTPDFIFRQTPWEDSVPAVFRSQMLGFAQLCYVPYGMMTVEKPREQYNQPFHNRCDLIFAESPYHYERYAHGRELGAQGVVQTGYPRFEQFMRQLEASAGVWPLPKGEKLPRVIWAPHHSVFRQWLNYSTFMEYKDLMLNEARRGRISLLFRPHPALRNRLLQAKLMTAAEWDAYLAAWAATGTSGVDLGDEYIDQFGASDYLITDGLGFFSEYLLTGKPLVRTWKDGAEPMNDFGQWCAECAREVRHAAALRAVLEEIAKGKYQDAKREMRLERRAELVLECQGASVRVVDTLENL